MRCSPLYCPGARLSAQKAISQWRNHHAEVPAPENWLAGLRCCRMYYLARPSEHIVSTGRPTQPSPSMESRLLSVTTPSYPVPDHPFGLSAAATSRDAASLRSWHRGALRSDRSSAARCVSSSCKPLFAYIPPTFNGILGKRKIAGLPEFMWLVAFPPCNVMMHRSKLVTRTVWRFDRVRTRMTHAPEFLKRKSLMPQGQVRVAGY